jgi:SAM-dependent methyltransferase
MGLGLRRRARQLGLDKLYAAGLRAAHRGDRVHCPCCGSSFRRFKAFKAPDRICWTCGSLERHRLVAHYFDDHPELTTPGMSILHIAPEEALARRLRAIPGAEYVGGDLTAQFGPVPIDVTAMQFADASFDAVLCNHVLEHVPDDRKAMAEIRRVLKPTGWALLLVPDVHADVTDEEPTISDPDEQLRRFGQDDHVRRYGWDYLTRLEEAGLHVDVIRSETLLPEETIERDRLRKFGEIEPLFFARPAPVLSQG